MRPGRGPLAYPLSHGDAAPSPSPPGSGPLERCEEHVFWPKPERDKAFSWSYRRPQRKLQITWVIVNVEIELFSRDSLGWRRGDRLWGKTTKFFSVFKFFVRMRNDFGGIMPCRWSKLQRKTQSVFSEKLTGDLDKNRACCEQRNENSIGGLYVCNIKIVSYILVFISTDTSNLAQN